MEYRNIKERRKNLIFGKKLMEKKYLETGNPTYRSLIKKINKDLEELDKQVIN